MNDNDKLKSIEAFREKYGLYTDYDSQDTILDCIEDLYLAIVCADNEADKEHIMIRVASTLCDWYATRDEMEGLQ